MAPKLAPGVTAAAVAAITEDTPTAGPELLAAQEEPTELAPEAYEGLPIDVERVDVVNSGTATDRQRAELQAALARLNSVSWQASKDVRIIRELLFGDADKAD